MATQDPDLGVEQGIDERPADGRIEQRPADPARAPRGVDLDRGDPAARRPLPHQVEVGVEIAEVRGHDIVDEHAGTAGSRERVHELGRRQLVGIGHGRVGVAAVGNIGQHGDRGVRREEHLPYVVRLVEAHEPISGAGSGSEARDHVGDRRRQLAPRAVGYDVMGVHIEDELGSAERHCARLLVGGIGDLEAAARLGGDRGGRPRRGPGGRRGRRRRGPCGRRRRRPLAVGRAARIERGQCRGHGAGPDEETPAILADPRGRGGAVVEDESRPCDVGGRGSGGHELAVRRRHRQVRKVRSTVRAPLDRSPPPCRHVAMVRGPTSACSRDRRPRPSLASPG